MSVSITKNIIKRLGLKPEEYEEIKIILNRTPSITELSIFSAMWSEHCSYKSSKFWLKKLPTEGECVIQGPGENAGVIDIGMNNAIVFKIESHNHPSYIEPYQGAATGVGGIMRDIFTMGARPIANLNCLRFGALKNKKTKYLFNGVVSGIGDYGNCTGIPTVGGECTFDKRYNNNILVNAMTVGIAKRDRIFYAKAGNTDNLVVYVGSKTGKDGIHGASMSSGSFNKETEILRPTVQVGDPFAEKLLMEACLELMKKNAIIGIQDMGAAGLTSSTVEIAASNKKGIKINLDKIPLRNANMAPEDIMLSESQERMLLILAPAKLKIAKNIFKKWSLDFSIIGKIIDKENIIIYSKKEKVADIPLTSLVATKYYKRNFTYYSNKNEKRKYPKITIASVVEKLLKTVDFGSKEFIWQQYDHMITRNVINRMGQNASIIKTNIGYQAIAVTTDCNIYYCESDPYLGAIQAISESYRNISSVGATPLAITNCLNFGNPEEKAIMGQFVSTIKGMREAALKLKLPVVSGNVSFYNETNDVNIPPTPQIGIIGHLKDFRKSTSTNCFSKNDKVYVIGNTKGHLSCSSYERLFYNYEKIKRKSCPPSVNLEQEIKNANSIRLLIAKNLISSCHDVSDGGIVMAIVEMCLYSKEQIELKKSLKNHSFLFGEDQSRYIITSSEKNSLKIEKLLRSKNIEFLEIGRVVEKKSILNFPDKSLISINRIKKLIKSWHKDLV